MQIRDANDEDVAGITAIYNDAVVNTAAIWNETQVDTDNRKRWLHDRGEVVGYASFGDWRAFDGYRHTVEHSVYVRNDQYRSGIGRALMVELIERAKTIGKHAMIAGIEAGNVASIRLHEKLGFQQVGLLPEVGTKFGRWLDLAFLQLLLDRRTEPDSPPTA
jgi:phosphinothricin acetyltransferase